VQTGASRGLTIIAVERWFEMRLLSCPQSGIAGVDARGAPRP
jgi:hypothetical protein